MKKLLNEFKEFALKGNMLDMAIGLIMGSAFSGLVTQLTDSFITPLLSLCTSGVNFDQLMFEIGGATFTYGKFISYAINFVLQAFVLFMLIRLFHSFQKKEEPAPETTKICPYCKSEIHIDAVKCPHCASDLPLDEKKEADKK